MTEIVGDWEIDLLDPLVANMRGLALVIARHGIIEEAEKVGAEVVEALALMDAWRNFDFSFRGTGKDIENYIAHEEGAWWDFWNYLGAHIRGWWD